MIYTVFSENLAGLLFPEFLLEKNGALHVSLEGFNVPDKWGEIQVKYYLWSRNKTQQSFSFNTI